MRSAPWRSAATRGCSACAGSMSRRSGATIRRRRGFCREAPRRTRRRSPGPDRRCWNSAARRATGTARSRRSRATARAACSTARRTGASAPCCSPRARSRAEENDRDAARALALEAVKLAPTLVPAAALAGRLLGEAGERRKAAQDHRDGLEGQSASRSGRDLRASAPVGFGARPARARAGAGAHGAGPRRERARGGARGARRAGVRGRARARSRRCSREPTQRVAHADGRDRAARAATKAARANGWRARSTRARDPAWTADGFVSDRWMPVSPVTGRLDAFQWKVPLAELGDGAGTPVLIEAPPEPSGVRNCRVRNFARAKSPRRRSATSTAENGRPIGAGTRRDGAPGARVRADHPADAGSGRSRPRAGGRYRRRSGTEPTAATPGNGFVSFSGETCPVRQRAGRPQAFPAYFWDCGRPSCSCGFGRGRLSEAPRNAAIAQLVEHRFRKAGVGGSSPSCGTTFSNSFHINRQRMPPGARICGPRLRSRQLIHGHLVAKRRRDGMNFRHHRGDCRCHEQLSGERHQSQSDELLSITTTGHSFSRCQAMHSLNTLWP